MSVIYYVEKASCRTVCKVGSRFAKLKSVRKHRKTHGRYKQVNLLNVGG